MENLSNINSILILLFSAFSIIFYLAIILYSDRNSKEPILLIILCILSGILTISISYTSEKIVGSLLSKFSYDHLSNIVQILLFASIEEICKFSVLFFFFSRTKKFDDILDGFVYSTIIALSFAGIETVVYIFREQSLSSMSTIALLRTFTSVPMHLVCGIIMGYYVSLKKFSKSGKKNYVNLVKSLIYPIILHAIFNIFIRYVYILKYQDMITAAFINLIIYIYIIGALYLKNSIVLNDFFIKNKRYPKQYKFLMNKRLFDRKMTENVGIPSKDN